MKKQISKLFYSLLIIIIGGLLVVGSVQAITRVMVPEGGTGQIEFESGAILIGSGVNAIGTTSPSSIPHILTLGNLYIGDSSNLASSSADIFVDTSGNVGIGTITPSYLLDIDGDFRAGTTIVSTLILFPPSSQSITSAGDTIQAIASHIDLSPDADYVFTSMPTISTSTAISGQRLVIHNISSVFTLDFQDDETLALSGIELGNGEATLHQNSSVEFIYEDEDGAWHLLSNPNTAAAGASAALLRVRNVSGSAISAGKAVYATGWNNGLNRLTIDLADADDSAKIPAIGMTFVAIPNGANGQIVKSGELVNVVDTSGQSVGTGVWLSTTAGEVVFTRPAVDDIQRIGTVLKVSAGNSVILVTGAGRINDVPQIFTATNITTTQDTWLATAGGNVGIGTTSPVFKLDVYGNMRVDGTLTVSGNVTGNNLNISNWDTAFGWGNHASGGYLTSQTSHADVLVDGDFGSNGIMTRTGAGTYAMLTDSSANWNTAYGWGNHTSGGYFAAADFNADFDTRLISTTTWAGDLTVSGNVTGNNLSITNWDTAFGWGNHASGGYLTSETSHADVLIDGDFGSNGIMTRTGAGTYAMLTDSSTNWNTAYGWGNHTSGGYFAAADFNADFDTRLISTTTWAGDLTVSGNVTGNNLNISNWDTAYGWGNHASGGYFAAADFNADFDTRLISTTTWAGDLTVSGNVTGNNLNISNWDTAFGWDDHASGGYLTSQTSHADVLIDGDFGSNGIMTRTGVGTYVMLTDSSTNWNTAYGWGNHTSGGYFAATDFNSDWDTRMISTTTWAGNFVLSNGTMTFPSLATPAGAFAALDDNGILIATTTPSGGGGGVALGDSPSWTGQHDWKFAGVPVDFQNTTDNNSNQVAIFRAGDRTSAQNNDQGYLSFYGDTEAGQGQQEFARILWEMDDVTNSSKDSTLRFYNQVVNTLTDVMSLVGKNLTVTGSITADDFIYILGDNNVSTARGLLSSTNSKTFLRVGTTAGTYSTIAPDYSAASVFIAGVWREAWSGNHPLIAQLGIKSIPIVLQGGTASISNTASLYIDGSASSTIVLEQNYALWVDGAEDISRIDGTLLIGATSTAPNFKLSIQGSALADDWLVYSPMSDKVSAIAEIKNIKCEVGTSKDGWCDIDHSSLPAGVRVQKDYIQKNIVGYEDTVMVDVWDEESQATTTVEWNKSIVEEKIITGDYMSISKMLVTLVQANQEIIAKLEISEARVKELDARLSILEITIAPTARSSVITNILDRAVSDNIITSEEKSEAQSVALRPSKQTIFDKIIDWLKTFISGLFD